MTTSPWSMTPGRIADERSRYHDRPGSDEAHCDGVEELTPVEPVVLLDHALAEEGNDGEAAAEDEGAGLEEEQEQPGRESRLRRSGGTTWPILQT